MGGARRTSPVASVAVALPPALRVLLKREGMAAARVEDVTSLPGSVGPRRTFRIGLADGRVVKGRILRGAEVASRMGRWIPSLKAGTVGPLLAV